MLLKVMPLSATPCSTAARGRPLQRQPEQDRRVEPMHRGPPVRAVAHVRRDTGLACGGDEHRDEAVVRRTMYGRSQAHHTRAHTPGGEVQARPLTGDAEGGDPGRVGLVLLGAQPAGGHDQRARRDDEWPARAFQRSAERLDRGPVAPHHVVEIGEVAAVRHVENAVGGLGAVAQTAEVVQRAGVRCGTQGFQPRRLYVASVTGVK
ncbi:hypothetical protein AB0C27_46035 [Nonomuraea sp. NPDC048882]|uniref:hypothetical protein n=1 Tax=Nonomuraea sp. NPDC048882 TaxID=3154347 RepID=UPI0033D564FC